MNVPTCTYRIQFNPRFTFNHLSNILDYLHQLGVTSIYASPILQPVKGSEHGYDGINTTTLNPELGSMDEMEALSSQLKARGMGWIQDIVPNHLAFHTTNVWLYDVLERGMNSSYASHFDIDWEHPASYHKLMVPFLTLSVAESIQQQQLALAYDSERGFFIRYFDNNYPINPDSYPLLLSGCLGDGHNNIHASLSALVNNPATDIDHWRKLKSDLLNQLSNTSLDDTIQARVKSINDDVSLLTDVINAQHYLLCPHTESYNYINYRRFFNVNGLICLRMEDERVFNDYHQFIHQLYMKGWLQGLRIDHIDGLKDPHEYTRRLRKLFGTDCYIIVEKILDAKEQLPPSLDIQGTSGYEFLSYINQVITDRKGSEKLLALYHEYVPDYRDYDDLVFRNKLANLETYLNGEWDNLLRLLLSLNLVEDEEIKITDLKLALGVFMAAFPVYRVYIESLPLAIDDEQLVVAAFVKANRKHPELSYQLGILRQTFEPHPDTTKNMNRLIFIQRVMQFTGPLAAKGIEDTTFYLYNPLISHNEVGDQPCVLGIPVREFHEKMQERRVKNSLSLNCTSTHDTKRGEDNRVRINVISEMTTEWTKLVAQWQKMDDPFRQQLDNGVRAPIINDEYFLYQAIMGSLPEDLVVNDTYIDRTRRYFTKVLRESKLMSDHVYPNIPYENACTAFIEHLLNKDHEFLPSLVPFVSRVIEYANVYALVQVIIKTTAPGIPDIYQGCELWDLSYVDPDNRRPVDFSLRQRLLTEMQEKEKQGNAAMLAWASDNYQVGTQKLLVTAKMLQLRRSVPRLFIEGDYIPVYAEGSERVVIAYFRQAGEQWLLVVLPLGIVGKEYKTLQLILPPHAPRNWKNIFTNEEWSGHTIAVRSVFEKFPVAVMTGVGNKKE